MMRGDWSDSENDVIVADYFAMLTQELAQRRYNKLRHNERLQSRIGRSHRSIEFKHRNISAVLKGLGETWINGYRPAFNYQASLETAVQRWLSSNAHWLGRVPAHTGGLIDPPQLWIGPPPTLSNMPEPVELEQAMRIARKFDAAARDERNRTLGRAGEERVLTHERAVLTSAGRPELASRIRWVSDEDGDGVGYDIASFNLDGSSRLIEVKTTNGWDRTPFHISRNEMVVAEERKSEWCLLRLWNFSRDPRAFELFPPLSAHVSLTPTSFEAAFVQN